MYICFFEENILYFIKKIRSELLTDDILLRNGYELYINNLGKIFFIKKTEQIRLFDNEYCILDITFILTKKYGGWLLLNNKTHFKKIEEFIEFDSNFDENTNKEKGFVYIIKSPFGYKIGKTKKFKNRLHFFKVVLPFTWEIVSLFLLGEYNIEEKKLHNFLNFNKIEGEWFNLTEQQLSEIDLYFQKKYDVKNIIIKSDQPIEKSYLL